MNEPHGVPGNSSLPPSKFGAGYTVGDDAGVSPSSGYTPDSHGPVRYPPPGLEPTEPARRPSVHYPHPGQESSPPPGGVAYPPAPTAYPVQMAPVGFVPAPRTNSMAIAALVSSLVLAPLGIVFGHIALSQIKQTGEDGRGLAIAGLVIGYVFTAIALLWVVGFVLLAAAFTSSVNTI